MSLTSQIEGYLSEPIKKYDCDNELNKDSGCVELFETKEQIELMKLIHEQFQIPAIKKLYPNPQWTERVFWVINGNIYHQFEDVSMDRLSEHIEQYITEHGYPGIKSVYNQRDTAKLIMDTIKLLQVDGRTSLTNLTDYMISTGITSDQLESTMKQMKRDGSVFEPSDGYYRCI